MWSKVWRQEWRVWAPLQPQGGITAELEKYIGVTFQRAAGTLAGGRGNHGISLFASKTGETVQSLHDELAAGAENSPTRESRRLGGLPLIS